MRSTVALVRCPSYDEAEVFNAMGRGLELLGGAQRFAAEGEAILLKPNLLVPASTDSCVTTHPSVFLAIARHLREAGARLTYGDSPAFGTAQAVARRAGLAHAADRIGVPLADFSAGREVGFPEGRVVKRWYLANAVLDADGIISLPKLKTHGLTRMTGAVKNTFGCVPGVRKGEFHARMGDVEAFSTMLVDLSRVLQVRLHVMDGIVAMEGNGPRAGTPRSMNVLLLSDDPVALDAVACRLINLDPRLVHTLRIGEDLELGSAHDIEVVGDPVEQFVAADFVVNRRRASTTGRADAAPISRFMRRWIVPKPVIIPERCTACGTCVKVCPVDPKAVAWATPGGARDGRPPVHDHTQCIRCYCCQEMCPEGAIEIDVPLLGRLIHR